MVVTGPRGWLWIGWRKSLPLGSRGDLDGNTSGLSVASDCGSSFVVLGLCTHESRAKPGAQTAGTLEGRLARGYEEGPTSRIGGILSSS